MRLDPPGRAETSTARPHDPGGVYRHAPGSIDRGQGWTAVGTEQAPRRFFAYPYIACGRKVASPGRSPMSTRSASIASQKGMIPR